MPAVATTNPGTRKQFLLLARGKKSSRASVLGCLQVLALLSYTSAHPCLSTQVLQESREGNGARESKGEKQDRCQATVPTAAPAAASGRAAAGRGCHNPAVSAAIQSENPLQAQDKPRFQGRKGPQPRRRGMGRDSVQRGPVRRQHANEDDIPRRPLRQRPRCLLHGLVQPHHTVGIGPQKPANGPSPRGQVPVSQRRLSIGTRTTDLRREFHSHHLGQALSFGAKQGQACAVSTTRPARHGRCCTADCASRGRVGPLLSYHSREAKGGAIPCS